MSVQGSIQAPSGSQGEGDDLSSGSNSQSESESMIGAYKWLGDGTVVGYDKQFWLPGIDFKQGEVIVYKYGGKYSKIILNIDAVRPFKA